MEATPRARDGSDPVRRVHSVGVRASSVIDLMAMAFSRRQSDVGETERIARVILERAGSISGLCELPRADVQEYTGLDEFEVLRLQAIMELGRRGGDGHRGPVESIESAHDVMAMFDHLRFEKREHFVAVLMDAKHRVIRSAPIHMGTLTMSIVGPREVFREAIVDGAAAIIVVHNHPSGDPTPSPEDLDVTRRLVEVGEMLDIPVVDHVIIGDRRCISLSELGMMKR